MEVCFHQLDYALTSNDDDFKQVYYIDQNNQIVFTSSNVPYYGKAYTDIFKSMSNEAKKHLGELSRYLRPENIKTEL